MQLYKHIPGSSKAFYNPSGKNSHHSLTPPPQPSTAPHQLLCATPTEWSLNPKCVHAYSTGTVLDLLILTQGSDGVMLTKDSVCVTCVGHCP